MVFFLVFFACLRGLQKLTVDLENELVPCPKSFAVHSGNLTYRINQAARSYC